jgi:hypothetical protein
MAVTRFHFDKTKIPFPHKIPGKPMTQKQVENLLGVSAMTIYLWRKAPNDPFPCRTIPTNGGGVRIFFPTNEVHDWVKRNRPGRYRRITESGGDYGNHANTGRSPDPSPTREAA